jgi:YebC/PmpR family DNA-binding regulatory protein
MAGHSQFKNIMHRKGAQDSKRAKNFTKLIREIVVAARAGGPDPQMNSQLRTALLHARQANMPKDNIDRALARATESGGENYEVLWYEAFGPHQVAFMVEVLTDNRNRAASEIRALFNKNGGHMGDTAYLFEHKGVIIYGKEKGDAIMEKAIEEGAIDFQESSDHYLILTRKEGFIRLREAMEEVFGPSQEAYLGWIPFSPLTLSDEDLGSVEKLISLLEDQDDVRSVWTNLG